MTSWVQRFNGNVIVGIAFEDSVSQKIALENGLLNKFLPIVSAKYLHCVPAFASEDSVLQMIVGGTLFCQVASQEKDE